LILEVCHFGAFGHLTLTSKIVYPKIIHPKIICIFDASASQHVQPQPRNLMDLGKRYGKFYRLVIVNPAAKGCQNIRPRQPPHGDNEGMTESLSIGFVQHLKFGKFLGAAPIKPGARLFGG
jgi:hypothetical protein